MPAWAQHGKCDLELDWFSQDKADWRECQKVCNSGCPVKNECLIYALETRQTHGVWGGCDPRRLREALGVDANGETHDYPWRLHCPRCSSLKIKHLPAGRRGVELCACEECGITWDRQIVSRRKKRDE